MPMSLGEIHDELSGIIRELTRIAAPVEHRIQVTHTRLVELRAKVSLAAIEDENHDEYEPEFDPAAHAFDYMLGVLRDLSGDRTVRIEVSPWESRFQD